MVNWSLTQAFLLDCASDILVLLDTCFGAKGFRNPAGTTKGACEIIAASSHESLAPGVSRLSFTRVLTRVLKNFAEKHRTYNDHLSAARLCSHLINYYYPQELQQMPYYGRPPDYEFNSCHIIPNGCSPNRFIGNVLPTCIVSRDPVTVLAAIHMVSTSTGDIVAWLQGQGVPSSYMNGVEGVEIMSVLEGNSAVVLFRCPVTSWLLMPRDFACTFIGLIRSDDLLQRVREKTNECNLEELVGDKTSDNARSLIKPDSKPQLPPPYTRRAIEASVDAFDQELPSYTDLLTKGSRGVGNENLYLRPHWDDQPPGLESYKYSRLGERKIRLACIHPGAPTENLVAHFVNANIDSLPQYYAISYLWGQDSRMSPLLVRSGSVLKVLKVATIPHSILRAFRHPSQVINVWIDAICINQQDFTERGAQIPFMSTVFKHASSVRVWLGQKTPYGQMAFDFARQITGSVDVVNTLQEEYLINCLISFSALLRNTWFRRVWVVQEVALARSASLHLGTDILPWQTFADAVTIVETEAVRWLNRVGVWRLPQDILKFFSQLSDQAAARLIDLINMRHNSSLESFVADTCLLVSPDPRDLIYSAVGIASNTKRLLGREIQSISRENIDEGQGLLSSSEEMASQKQPLSDNIIVDYSAPVLQVYKDFIQYSIEHSGSLDIICRPWATANQDLPSWIPTTDKHAFAISATNHYYRHNADSLTGRQGNFRANYTASRRSRASCKLVIGAVYELDVEGFMLDSIGSTAPPAVGGNVPYEWLRMIGWTTVTSDPPDCFWRTLVANRGSNNDLPPLYYRPACRAAFQKRGPTDDLQTSPLVSLESGLVAEFLRRVQAVVWARRLVVTSQMSFLGLAPRDCQVGDLVCILFGCSVPIILRKLYGDNTGSETSEPHFRFIGEAYIHGMMDGEAMSLRAIQPQTFRLV